jgi:hypothetical protein
MSKYGRLPVPIIPNEEPKTNPVGNVGIVILEQKKKPHNVTIKNHNPSEPKTKPNTKYSAKQSYRRYKTRTEPNLFNKIQVNEDDDIVSKIQEALGIKPEGKKSNFSEVETSSVPFYKGVDDLPVERIADRREPTAEIERPLAVTRGEFAMSEISDYSMEDAEALTNSFMDEASDLIKYNIRKHLSRKTNKNLAKDLADAMMISKLDDTKDVIVSEVKRGNKVIALDWYQDTSPKRTQKYSLGLDVALPTPKKMDFPPKTKDAGTSPRTTKGRPRKSEYFNPPPTGEMTNPATAY